ncbi:MAG: ABC transporter permease [Chromatiales bacterium]|nr:MAG: ABC transporter permease [Chromatiales bacterium]
MKTLQTLALALRTLWRNPLRTLLMMLGVAIGIASLTTMTSVGEATKQQTLREFKNMVGTFDVVNISPGGGRTRGMPSLTTVEPTLKFADAAAIAAELAGVRQVAEVQNAFDIDVKYRDNTTASAMYGISANWLEMHSYFVAAGNLISADDIQSLARVAVIGPDVSRELFPGEDPLGKQIRVGNVPFQVKGVLESRGAGPGGSSLDNIVFIPVTTASKRLFNRDYLTTITVQLDNPDEPDPVVADITALLRERHGIVPPGEDDFTINNPRAAALRVSNVRSTLSAVLAGTAGIATLIGGTVIMGLMLVAVSERRREIGVRRAVGATRGDVLSQFLIEAALVSALGGVIGIAIGVSAAVVVAVQRALPPVVLWQAVGGALLLSVAVGLVFGLQPAWKAARVDPIDALRS